MDQRASDGRSEPQLIRWGFLAGLIALFATAAFIGSASAQQSAPPVHAQIWCHDEVTDLLSRKWSADCKGKVVSDADAKEIQQRRVKRIQDALQPPKAPVDGKRQIGSGSGMIVSADGHVLTNNHVIDHCDAFSITPVDGKAVPAELVAGSVTHDLALLRASFPAKTIAAFLERDLPPATDIAVVGYPLLGRVAIKPILVEGSVYIGGRAPSPDRFMINMDIRHGNSGGPVVDRAGRVGGIVVAKVNTPAVYAETGKAIYEVGTAIRTAVALSFMRQNGVSPIVAQAGPDLEDAKLYSHVRGFVAQVGCWK